MQGNERERLAGLRPNFERRAVIIDSIRSFFRERDFLEVDTPTRVPCVAPEPAIIPVESEGWFLSTSPELHMKRLLASGYPRLFQLSKCFRRGERGRWHNPEFVMLEWYRTGTGYNELIEDTARLVAALAETLGLGTALSYQGKTIDISRPWPRTTVREAYTTAAGWDPVTAWDEVRFDVDFIDKVLPSFSPVRPTVLTGYPAAAASLAQLDPENPGVAERAEIFIGGLELANAYTELVDASEQENRFREAIAEIQREGRAASMPQSFIEALPYLPPCGGIALGVDRLVMLLCDAASIDDVMPFTSDTA